MIWLAMLIATWAVYGAGRQVGHDARAGIGTARQRTAQRVAEIRKDRTQPQWKRRTATAAVGTAKLSGAAARGARYAGRSAWTGAKWGVTEGRARHAERAELREARPLSDADDRQSYRQVRDRVLHDRAERLGRPGVSVRKVRRIAKRDAREDERLRATEPTTEPEAAAEPTPTGEPEPTCDGRCANSDVSPTEAERAGLCGNCGGRGELVWNFGDEHGHFPCQDCNPDGPRWTRPRVDGSVPDDEPGAEPGDEPPASGPAYEPEPQHINGSTNGGTATMTAPTSNGFRTNGEATTISGARAAWASFEGYAVESLDTAGAAEQEAKNRAAAAAQMLDVSTAAANDAKQQAAAAQALAASLADSDMGDPQAIADAEAQQEQAARQEQAAVELQALAEGEQATAARIAELAGQLRSAAESSQAHCVASLQGMNTRNARREAFFKD